MKRTDIERRDRELKRMQKKEEIRERKDENGEVADITEYTNRLFKLFFYDEDSIYNIDKSVEILELIEEMNMEFDEKELDNAIRKAIRMTKITGKKKAFEDLKALLE